MGKDREKTRELPKLGKKNTISRGGECGMKREK